MIPHFLSNFSPFCAKKFGASPFNQKQRAEENMSSSPNTPLGWNASKQKSINDCSFRSPDRRINSKSPFRTRQQSRISREVSVEGFDELGNQFRCQEESEKEVLNSGRFLNFGFSARFKLRKVPSTESQGWLQSLSNGLCQEARLQIQPTAWREWLTQSSRSCNFSQDQTV